MLLHNNLVNLSFFFSILFIMVLTTGKIVYDRVGSVIKIGKGVINNYLMMGGLKYDK